MPKANELKRGSVIEINGHICIIRDIDVKSPSARGASTLYKVRAATLGDNQKVEQTFKGEEMVPGIDFHRGPVQFLFREGTHFHFMHSEEYSQFILSEEDLAEQAAWLADGLEGLVGLFVEGSLVGIELPPSVVLTIIETAPAMKGASATKRTKPATTDCGVTVQVPEYIETGERIRVNTATQSYMARE